MPTLWFTVYCVILYAVPEQLPDKLAVIVPALKFPDASLATIVEPVFTFVAFVPKVTAVDPLYDVPVK